MKGLNFKPLFLSVFILILYGLIFLGQYYMNGSFIYLIFGLFVLVLAYGVVMKSKVAITVALLFSAFEFLMALFYLMSGAVLYAVDAVMSFLLLHDLIGYIEESQKQEKEETSGN